jgi:hypothetical protein
MEGYIMSIHEPELRSLARLGSWRARELLGLEKTEPYLPPSDEELAERFLFGNTALVGRLRSGYSGWRVNAETQ